MNSMNYIGLDIHKKSISCCVRQADGTIMSAPVQKSPYCRLKIPHPLMKVKAG
jgi:hypothetical protein